MRRVVGLVIGLNLAIIAVLAIVFPDLMVGPGRLIDGHRDSETDCFACHDTFFGASAEKCIACHKVADIGVLTTKGIPLVDKKTKVPFHQKLVGRDCVACHSDHVGVAKYRIRQRFSHALVDASTRQQCVACHQRPKNALHRQVPDTCKQCHTTDKWKPATFKHAQLKPAKREQCVSCHKTKAPADTLHRQVSDKCGACHTTDKWKPATFDHNKYFVFDRDHDAKCTVCHTTPDYKKYTCYGCHEHSPAKVREEHWEEGIRDFEICVTCHRSADEDEAERAWESLRRGVPYRFDGSNRSDDKRRKKRKKHDDDD